MALGRNRLRGFPAITALVALGLFFTACASFGPRGIWLGKSEEQLREGLGNPNAVHDDGRGGRYLLYWSFEPDMRTHDAESTEAEFSNPFSHRLARRRQVVVDRFHVGKDGIVDDYDFYRDVAVPDP